MHVMRIQMSERTCGGIQMIVSRQETLEQKLASNNDTNERVSGILRRCKEREMEIR